MSKKYVSPADFILPININGLDGRMLGLPAVNRRNKSELLIIYGQRSNLERWWGLASALRQYSNVTMVDLPGMGGMDSFYNIRARPTIDNFADYIASFIKLRYKRKQFSVLGIGLGFVLLTRMLQRNPDLIPKVKLVIGINGYAHHDDLKLSKGNILTGIAESHILSLPMMPFLVRTLAYNSLALNYKYDKLFKDKAKNQFLIRFQIDLDKAADMRTTKYLMRELNKLDNCQAQIDLPLWNVTLGDNRQQLKPRLVEQHLRVVYKNYRHAESKLAKNVPFIINDEKIGQKVLPAVLRRQLKK